MIENTIEQKSVFVAKYWGQKVMHYYGNLFVIDVDLFHLLKDKETFLQLTPRSMITDEHAVEVGKIFGHDIDVSFNDDYYLGVGKRLIKNFPNIKSVASAWQIICIYNFLISKGYYVGDGRELEYKWAVLKTDK